MKRKSQDLSKDRECPYYLGLMPLIRPYTNRRLAIVYNYVYTPCLRKNCTNCFCQNFV